MARDALRSSPPFPSPGSSFLPPPTPGPHEFARPPSAGRKLSKKDLNDLAGVASHTAANGHTCNGQANPTTPNGAESPPPIPTTDSFPGTYLDPRSLGLREGPSAPADPPPPPHRLLINPESHDVDDSRVSPQPPHRLSTQSVTSLTSSRPAPPSPAISRRASGLSRTSSKSRSRPVSGVNSRPVSSTTRPISGALSPNAVLSRTPSGRRAKDVLGMSAVVEKEPEPAPADSKVLIKIRDFAFAPSDVRFSGEGPNVPRPNRPKVLARRLRGSSSSTSSMTSKSSTEEEDEQWEDENDSNGWGGFKWGLQKLQSGWGFASSSSSSTEDFPSRTDFARNFGNGVGDDDESEVYDEPDDFFENQEENEEMGEPTLHPGLYRALYAFEPEGTAEMKLEEDQVVRVVGRGGGVGWAVVVKDGLKDTGAHALVPESYLEVVRLDGDEED
ncbi:uncharacterized protein EDB91DRAFT_1149546 [Suillus paluster]|uniref:uncharacterized protein n=1 Tax=Suillus paluster TaxID=48578 RepID=UPI001B8777F2|nr:uncharacterized protein EDB91DRAFT_1149546 [Suillus paluster]KAG1733217.1 hypothetical protein EDB91DRAFT_1149546 [Suillus paluster]